MPYNKHLWQLVSGIHYETPEETVQKSLSDVSEKLCDGLLQFKPACSSKTDVEKLLKEKCQEKLIPFTKKLQELLDLETTQCWEILCFYLVNEFRGSASSLASFVASEANTIKLLDDIWGFFSLERMVVLKIVKNLLHFYQVEDHPFHEQYVEVVDKITLLKLRDSYLKQFKHLLEDQPPSSLKSGQSKLRAWSERNAREINEVLQILILLVSYIGIDSCRMVDLFNNIKSHNFGRSQLYLEIGNGIHQQLIQKMCFSEIALFLKCLDISPSDKNLDIDWMKEIIAKLSQEIEMLHSNPENGPIFLSWMLLNFRVITGDCLESDMVKFRRFGAKAVHLNCFKFFHEMVTHPMYKDDTLVSQIVRKTIYDLISYMCDLFDGDGSMAKQSFIYELLCGLISWNHLAKEFCAKEEGGVRSLYMSALEMFPINFNHLTMISTSLCEGGMSDYVQNQLLNLPLYGEIYDTGKYTLQATEINNEYILTSDYKPFRTINFKIPRGTQLAVLENENQCSVHFRTKVNFYHILQNEISCLLYETNLNLEDQWKRVNTGVNFLKTKLAKIKAVSDIEEELVFSTEMCIDILNKFKVLQNPPIELMANCLEVCSVILPVAEQEISNRVINLNLLPYITNNCLDYKQYSNGASFDSGLVGMYLVNIEKKLEKYSFFVAYLKFLRTFERLETQNLFQMEIPGLIFLIREVFPHLHTWRFQDEHEKNHIYTEVMGFISDILDISTQCKEKRILRDICVLSLLNLENGVVLLRFIALGNPFLQLLMEMESNWMAASSNTILPLVRYSMKILMQLLRLKTTIFESNSLSPLEALIYTQPKQRDTLRIIPVVTSYMNNIFDRWLPILSCRLLKRIALEFNMSLLACLDMEADQIRLTFLSKLPDDLESDNLKIAILELVEACIEKQPGVTEAFFKVNFDVDKSQKDKGPGTPALDDSILTFMQDYLDAVQETPTIIRNPLSSRVLSLFHALWKNSMQGLVDDLIKKPNFWQSLTRPLFTDLLKNVKAYNQLFNILGIEVYCSTNKTNESVKTVLNKFLETENHFEKWVDYVFDLPKLSKEECALEETQEWLSQLQSFKDFIVILLKKNTKGLEISDKKLKYLARETLKVVVERGEHVEDHRPFIILAELYLIVLQSFKHSYANNEEEEQEIIMNLIKLLSNVSSCYDDIHTRAKDACIAITIKITQLNAEELKKDYSISLTFLHSVVNVICLELNKLEYNVKIEVKSKDKINQVEQHSNSLILSLNLLKTVAVVFQSDGPHDWDKPFIHNKVFNRLLSCTSWILQLFSKHKLTVELLDVLIVFAKGSCSNEFLHCDIGDYLWLKLLPPKALLEANYGMQIHSDKTWTVEKWWPIYQRGIEFILILFEKNGYAFLKDLLTFIGIHEQFLIDSLLLGKQSLEPNAMLLVKTTVHLIAKIVKYEKEWRLEHSQSLFSLMRCVQVLMGHSISLFTQHKNLKCLISGRRTQMEIIRDSTSGDFADEIITALNDLTEIIILCSRCLQQFSPSVLDLVCEPEFFSTKWEPLFEIQFGLPKLTDDAQLTFGVVLSAIGIFTKCLNLQNYGFNEVPLNILPEIGDQVDKPTTDSTLYTTAQTSRSHFSKSMSTVSVSSTTAPPNELLSSLDSEMCLMALEHILFLVVSQSMLALKNCLIGSREKQLIKREISTELITYHEFIRKKVLIDFREHKEIWYRRKHGIRMMNLDNEDDINTTNPKDIHQRLANETQRRSTDLNSMRVNVVRKLHLQQKAPKAPSNFEMSKVYSPIVGTSKQLLGPAVSSTPQLSRPPIRRNWDESEIDSIHSKSMAVEEEIQYFPPEEPSFTPLSYVQLVEEDYLHFMSNLYTVICQSE